MIRRILIYLLLPIGLYLLLLGYNVHRGSELANDRAVVVLLVPLIVAVVMARVLAVAEKRWLGDGTLLKSILYGLALWGGLVVCNLVYRHYLTPPAHLSAIGPDTLLPERLNLDIDRLEPDFQMGAVYDWEDDYDDGTDGYRHGDEFICRVYYPLRQRPDVWVMLSYSHKYRGSLSDGQRQALTSQWLEEARRFNFSQPLRCKRQQNGVSFLTKKLQSDGFRQKYESLYGKGSLDRFLGKTPAVLAASH